MEIKVNGIKLFYEVYGDGKPIILVHGNQESHEIFDKLIEKLKNRFKVYAIDSRCHGKSENSTFINYDLMTDDIILFIKELKIDKPIFYGFSDGGIIGLKLAIKEPNLLDKLIVSGANAFPKGLKLLDYLFCKALYSLTKNKLIKMMLEEPNLTKEDFEKISVETIVIAGEKDAIKQEHTKWIADCIKGSKLVIVPGEDHGSYIIHNTKIYDVIEQYL